MAFSTFFIKTPPDWKSLTDAVQAMTRGAASEVRFIASANDAANDRSIVDVVVMQLYGAADYALEIDWKGMIDVADDAVGMYLALQLKSPVLIPGSNPTEARWLKLEPDGVLHEIDMDMEELGQRSVVEYTLADCPEDNRSAQ